MTLEEEITNKLFEELKGQKKEILNLIEYFVKKIENQKEKIAGLEKKLREVNE